MVGKARASYIRISPRKVRHVMDIIRGKVCPLALAELRHSHKHAAYHITKLLNSALSNVETKSGFKPEQLYVSKLMADSGPTLKRFRARAMGRAASIMKRTSHIYLELDLVPGAMVSTAGDAPKKETRAVSRKLKQKAAAGAA